MEIIFYIIKTIAVIAGCLAALMSILLYIRLRWPAPGLWFLKLFSSALSPFFVVAGLFCAVSGVITHSLVLAIIGSWDILIFIMHIYRVTRSQDSSSSFETTFGENWENQIQHGQIKYLIPERTSLTLPVVPDPRFKQNISFHTIPGTNRRILCDIWQPPENIAPSGLAFIYLHGSAWYFLDKDAGTRPLFRHLTAQGHVIMDVAYRLAPETDFMGMVADAKHAVAWIKENASVFNVDPECIVLGGGSAGAHIALLAAYTDENSQFAPQDLYGKSTAVCGVISLYGPADLTAMYYHTNQHITTRFPADKPNKPEKIALPEWIKKRMGANYYRLGFDKSMGNFALLLGGHPDQIPDAYTFFSPITHVHSNCPPTLMIQGEHDCLVPVKATRRLRNLLKEKHVPLVYHEFPQSDHAFDLVLPNLSPSSHNAIYDIERFLAIMCVNKTASIMVND